MRYNPPHLVAHIIRNQKGSITFNGNAKWPSHCLDIGIQRARQNILQTTRGCTVRERHEMTLYPDGGSRFHVPC